jgi:uncharacterized membrane protein YdjX (TVP38/TMEM64 family)
MGQYRRIIILVAVIIVIFVAIKLTGGHLTFENLQKSKLHLQKIVDGNYFLSILGFIFLYILAAALSIPGSWVLTMAGGFLFGTILAAIFVNIGATIGATLAFLLARYVIGKWIQDRYENKLSRFNKELSANGARFLITLRLITIFPFSLINIVAGLTKVNVWTFVWTTSLGIFPGSLVYSFAGSRLNYIESPKDIFSVGVLLAFVLLGLFAISPVIIKRIRSRWAEAKV